MTPERLATIKAEVAEFRRAKGWTRGYVGPGTADELVREVEKLQGLLKPFAVADDSTVSETDADCWMVEVPLSDCRRAREALQP